MSDTRSKLMLVFGGLLLALAAVPGTAIESFFGRTPGALSWGPTLFRVLLALHGLVLIAASRLGSKREDGRLRVFSASDPLWALGAMCVLAFALRLPGLDTSLWLDEILTMTDFVRMPLGHILTSFPNQNQHMLFSILAHASVEAFGESAWAVRLPSVLLGVASVPALYLLTRKLLSTREALLTALLMTVSYHHIWFSQNARGYMGVLLFTIVATWLWIEALESDRWSVWVAYAVALFLGMWIHMTVLFVIAAHGLIWIFDCLRSRRIHWKALGAWALFTTFTLQAVALSLPEFLRSALHEVSMPSEWTNPLWVVRESFRSLQIGFFGSAVVIGGGLFVLAGWLGVWRRHPRAAIAMVLPAIIGGSAMLVLGHNLWPRFFFFSMGFALMIVVHGATLIPSVLPVSAQWRQYAATAGALVIVAASAITVPRCYRLPKQDFTGARDYVEQRRTAGDEVIVAGLAAHAYGRYYAPHWKTVETPEDVEQVRSRASRVTLVFTLPVELEAFHPALWRELDKKFEKTAVFPGTLGGGEVFICEERGPRATVDAANLRSTRAIR